MPPQAVLVLVGLLSLQCTPPGRLHALAVIRMNRLNPTPSAVCLRRLSGVALPGWYFAVETAVRIGHPHDRGGGEGERAIAGLTPFQGGLRGSAGDQMIADFVLAVAGA